MKKSLIVGLIATSLLIVSSSGLSAGKMKRWTWKRYSIQFKLPSNWKVTKNTRTALIAKGDGVVMKIGPSRGAGTAMGIAQKAYRSYSVMNRKRIMAKRSLRRGNSGLNRYIIFGKGKYSLRRPRGYRGRPITFGIIGLTKPGTKLYVRFYWFSDRKTAQKNNRNTYKIAKSFKKL